MTQEQIQQLITAQRGYFLSGATLPVQHRVDALKRLRAEIIRREVEIHAALRADLGKGNFESYMCETGMTLSELSYMISHTRRFAREKTVMTPLAQFCSRSYRKPSPRGVVLIMSPWNYPFMLTMEPLADAIAAGNTVILKPSAYSPATSAVIAALIAACFAPEEVAVVTGGRAENTALLQQDFDYIFFTGGQTVGREVMRSAAEHLTPITLELGGKSPCIVDKTANLRLAARRIVFGKYLNCGQTCVAPDYLYCDASIRDQLLEEIKKEITRQFGARALENADYGHIIHAKHFDRICALMEGENILVGGESCRETLQIAPTVLADVSFDAPVMGEEIFGPVMPVLTFESVTEAIAQLQSMPHPLALYLFSSDRATIRAVTEQIGFGGGCINDTIIHLATSAMPFGGFGQSGMGGYHGKVGFETFSHLKSIVDKKTWLDLPMRYQPYRGIYEKMLRFFLR